ncbi:MAG TPA: glucosaminidase domain-containing protein [Chloroflexota bacterium]|nr:glucosaminidase domain-containing protein [Chloroflexota bacterium]
MIVLDSRPLPVPLSNRSARRRGAPLSALGLRVLAIPALVLALLAALALHQPSDQAGAYSPDDGAAYSAQVVGTAGLDLAPSQIVPARSSGASSIIQLPGIHPIGHPAARLLPPATGDTVAGGPTISPAQINAVLAAYGSPMAGDGQALYNLGVQYGIDPAYCLAFFVHESGAGTQGEAVLTHNLGNIRAIAGLPSLDGYRYFDTWLDGAKAWYELISGLYIKQWKLATVGQIIPVYAPSGDSNDPTAYIDGVQQLVAGWRAQSGL